MTTAVAVRTFSDSPAVRRKVPLFIGMVGAPGSGKTFSALRLATGIKRIVGGEIGGIDTEGKRMLHYAPPEGEKADPSKGTFEFRHLDFAPPHGPQDFLAAIESLYKKGCKVIICDSTTHEHTGLGGVLEQHSEQIEVLAKAWNTSPGKVTQSAWKEPKSARRRFINSLIQWDVIVIFCFRAKQGTDFDKKGKEADLGWEPEGGKEIFYEMMLTCLLPPRSGGVPDWASQKAGEIETIKLPRQFKAMFADRRPLDERHGEELAKWSLGGTTNQPPVVAPPATPPAPQPAPATVAAPSPTSAPQPPAASSGLSVTGPIEDAMVTTGVSKKTGKPWERVGIKVGGTMYGSFDLKFEEWIQFKGRTSPITIHYKEEGNFKTIEKIEFAPEPEPAWVTEQPSADQPRMLSVEEIPFPDPAQPSV